MRATTAPMASRSVCESSDLPLVGVPVAHSGDDGSTSRSHVNPAS